MATSARKKKSESTDVSVPVQLSLVMNGHNPFWKSDLFDRTYLENDVPVVFKEMWETDEAGPFYEFTNDFMNLCEELKGEKLSSWNEQNTINKVIKPVLKMLGYFDKCSQFNEPYLENEAFTVQEHGEAVSYRPDLILVDDPKELKHIQTKKGEEKLEKAQKFVILPIEAKYWERITDKENLKAKEDRKRVAKTEDRDETSAMEFDDQTLKYMDILEKDYGILTDGKVWRLYNREISTQNKNRYFEFDLGKLMFHVQGGIDKDQNAYSIFVANAKYFYHIFSKSSLHGKNKFVDQLLEFSKKYVSQVEEDLKERFVKAMSIACNGFKDSAVSAKENVDHELIRNVAESHLFNILFIRFCEVRNILPVKQDPTGYRLISISNVLDKLVEFDPELEEDGLNLEKLKENFKSFSYRPDGTEIYDGLIKLTKIVQDGSSKEYDNFEIEGFKETIFSKDEWKFALNHKLTNEVMVNILFQLGYSKPEVKVKGRTYQQIPYNFFSPRQLGSIYESFLEFKIDRASEDMIFIKKQWQPANLKSDKVKKLDVPKVKKGNLFFTPNNEARKVTGAYYTPDPVVQLIVRETLGPLVKGKKSSELLKMKVADVAMGSAHFLSGTLTYLAQQYLEKLKKEKYDDVEMTLIEAKQEILHNCIYGVDINPRAVKLTKMSLWLESASINKTLEELDDQIKCTNSLTDYNLWKKEWKFLDNGIDAVVGNPPYLGEKGHKEIFQEISKEWLGERFYQGKMDLFYFFFHLGLDILKDNGRLGFITTNYYTTALGAKKLRHDFYNRSNIDLLINLNELKVFGEASGQHNMITVLTKTEGSSETRIINSNENGKCDIKILSEIYNGLNKKSVYSTSPKEELFDSDEKYIRINKVSGGSRSKGTASQIDEVIEKMKSISNHLGEMFDINTGIQTGADKVGKKHLEKNKSLDSKKGDGIFVLNTEEVKKLNLTKGDSDVFLKPFFKNSDVNSFGATIKNSEYVIYTDRKCKKIPAKIESHLSKFKTILDQRREVKNKVIDWFQLQWPRENEIFIGEKIIAPQRSKLNKFGYFNGAWYASCDVYFITRHNKSDVPLKYVLGLLNSKLYFCWLYIMGKRKGEALELYQKPLSEIPIKIAEQKVQQQIIKLVESLQHDFSDKQWNMLNQSIYEIFNLSKSEIAAIEKMYDERLQSGEEPAEEPNEGSDEAA